MGRSPLLFETGERECRPHGIQVIGQPNYQATRHRTCRLEYLHGQPLNKATTQQGNYSTRQPLDKATIRQIFYSTTDTATWHKNRRARIKKRKPKIKIPSYRTIKLPNYQCSKLPCNRATLQQVQEPRNEN